MGRVHGYLLLAYLAAGYDSAAETVERQNWDNSQFSCNSHEQCVESSPMAVKDRSTATGIGENDTLSCRDRFIRWT